MPQRFGLTYVAPDGAERQPVMIHRAMLGSLERFLAILIEQTAGAFPALARARPGGGAADLGEVRRVRGRSVRDRLAAADVRVELDDRNEKLGYRIREAQLQKVPYMLVVGAREQEDGTVSVRRRAGEDLGAMTARRLPGAGP